MANPFISVCIPAYDRVDFLKRLLDSITIQNFKDFEVVIMDDSPNDSVEKLCEPYHDLFSLKYKKNASPLGTPQNWNESIRNATGQWIKLMHDDDWFANAHALEKFAGYAQNEESAFIFSAYCNHFEETKKEVMVTPEKFRLTLLEQQPSILMAKNFVGPPSVVLHKNDGQFFYDPELKWLVDIDMYIRRIGADKVVYIPEALVKVGISNTQVTASVKNVGEVEIPEHFHFLEKMGIDKLQNIMVYDYWWRFIRNFKIRDIADFRKYGYHGAVHPVLLSMIKTQKKIPLVFLKRGFISKSVMTLHFLENKKQIK